MKSISLYEDLEQILLIIPGGIFFLANRKYGRICGPKNIFGRHGWGAHSQKVLGDNLRMEVNK